MGAHSLTTDQLSVINAWANTAPGLSELILFGSRARGDHRVNSDLDIAYRLSSDDLENCESNEERKAEWAVALSAATGLCVDLWHVYPALDIRLWENIQREGKLIFSK